MNELAGSGHETKLSMRSIDTATRLCAVIGNPVEHSFSPLMHNAAFEATGLNYVYVAFRVEDLEGCLRGMRAMPGFRGMSVTIPHKIPAVRYIDAIDPIAKKVGCVNTIVNEDGRLLGSTTDGVGVLRAFTEAGVPLEGTKVLFVGSGGAVRSVAFALADLAAPAAITVLGRTASRVAALVNDLCAQTAVRVQGGRLPEDLAEATASHDVVIQGTPLGMYPDSIGETCIPSTLLRPELTVFDMVYRPYRTRLMREAEEAGCRTILGAEMLVNQAVLQFETWTGVPAPREVMRNRLVVELEDEEPGASASRRAGGFAT